MAKITSKPWVTVPQALATQYSIRPGDEGRFEAAEDVIRMISLRVSAPTTARNVNERLELFDAATRRQRPREAQARREAEEIEMLTQFVVLYPNETVVRTTLRGAAAYNLSWFDAHICACPEVYGLAES